MRKIVFLSLLITSLLIASCSSVSKEDLTHIKGYWEINSVKSHGEVFSPKGAAPAVDHYTFINDSMGYKKKMVPSFGDNYTSSEDKVPFKIITKRGDFFLEFSAPLEVWEEKIESLSPDELVLFHKDNSYHYHRHQKINY